MKEKKEQDILRDLFVKLKPIFLKDAYIYKSRYIISGEYSNQKVAGDYLCILEDKFSDVIKNWYKESEVIYIKDLVLIKDDLDNNYEILKEGKKVESVKSSIGSLLENIDSVDVWGNLVEKCPGIVERFFKEKHIYSIPVGNGKSKIYVGKPFFPTVTEKNMVKVFFHTNYLEDRELYELLIRYNHTHFQLYMNYFAIPIEL